MRKLASYVYVIDPDGANVALGPDDTIPDWALAQITNPKAWAEAPEPVEGDGPSVQNEDGDGEADAPATVEAVPADPENPDAIPAEIVAGDDDIPVLQDATPQPKPEPVKPTPKRRRTRAAAE